LKIIITTLSLTLLLIEGVQINVLFVQGKIYLKKRKLEASHQF
ncbi:unnamed protein product, partial [marine sediment metagenome]